MKRAEAEASSLTKEELQWMLATVKTTVSPAIYALIEKLVNAFLAIRRILEGKRVSIARLHKLVFGAKTEKTDSLFPKDKDPDKETPPTDGPEGKKKRKGHGRNGVKDYPGAEKIYVPHDSLKAGCQCPSCQQGKLHLLEPAKVLRILGQSFLKAKLWLLERLRCGLCGDIFWAKLPAEAGKDKFNAEAAALIALLKYGSGLPFNRLKNLLKSFSMPVSASVQWTTVRDMAAKIDVILDALIFQAAQAEIIHNDDTKAKILKVPQDTNQSDQPGKKSKKRTGTFTTALVSIVSGIQIALFFTGRKHAGENLNDLLRQRHEGREPVIQMCDGQDYNEPDEFDTIPGNCLSHARRKFTDVIEQFPEECRRVLLDLREVYRVDAMAKKQRLSKEERLRLHQTESGPVMDKLKAWFEAQFNEKKVEKNSGLGEAISYMLRRWSKLTLFLRQAGAPIDNNLCERVLKVAILHRKNSYFYKTKRGAAVGDLFMSIIHTCRLNDVDSFDYLVAVFKHADKVQKQPTEWFPWNYKEALKALTPSQPPVETPQAAPTTDHRPEDPPTSGLMPSVSSEVFSPPPVSASPIEPVPARVSSPETQANHPRGGLSHQVRDSSRSGAGRSDPSVPADKSSGHVLASTGTMAQGPQTAATLGSVNTS